MTQNVALQFLITTPPITRALISLIVLTTLLVYLNILQPHQLTYSRFYLQKLQLHRVLTAFIYFGRPSIEIALHIIFLYRYSLMLENSFIKISDYFYMLLVIFLLLFILSNIYYIPLLGPSLSCTITYIWTRKNPQTVVQIMGFVSFYAFYLPFIVPMFTLVFEGKVSMEEILGIIVGHIVYYLQDVYPRFGSTILRTPCWCHKLFNERGACCSARRANIRKIRDFPQTDRSQQLNTAASVHYEAVENLPADVPASEGTVELPSFSIQSSMADNKAPVETPAGTADKEEKDGTEYVDFDWDLVEEIAAVEGEKDHSGEDILKEKKTDAPVADVQASREHGVASSEISEELKENNKAGVEKTAVTVDKNHSEEVSDFEVIELSDEEEDPAGPESASPTADDEELWIEASNEDTWGSEEIN